MGYGLYFQLHRRGERAYAAPLATIIFPNLVPKAQQFGKFALPARVVKGGVNKRECSLERANELLTVFLLPDRRANDFRANRQELVISRKLLPMQGHRGSNVFMTDSKSTGMSSLWISTERLPSMGRILNTAVKSNVPSGYTFAPQRFFRRDPSRNSSSAQKTWKSQPIARTFRSTSTAIFAIALSPIISRNFSFEIFSLMTMVVSCLRARLDRHDAFQCSRRPIPGLRRRVVYRLNAKDRFVLIAGKRVDAPDRLSLCNNPLFGKCGARANVVNLTGTRDYVSLNVHNKSSARRACRDENELPRIDRLTVLPLV